MATKLKCPKCQGDLPAANGAGPPVCPKCRAATGIAVGKPANRPTSVARAKPYRAPTRVVVRKAEEDDEKSNVLVPLLLACLVFLVLGGGGWYAWSSKARQAGPAEASIDAPDNAVAAVKPSANGWQPFSPNASPSTTSKPAVKDEIQPLPDLPADDASKPAKTSSPRVRVLAKVDPVAGDAPPLGFVEIKRPGSGGAAKMVSKSVDQAKVDLAIKNGTDWLKTHPAAWIREDNYGVGYGSLCALALLEVGVAADDPIIAKATALVRRKAPASMQTYQISLAILFLDRLGDPADEPLIRTLALRLVAGQTGNHGWHYNCPILTPDLEMPLLTMLEKLKPEGKWHMPLGREPGRGIVELAIPLPGPARVNLESPLDGKVAMNEEMQARMVMPMAASDGQLTQQLAKEFPDALRNLVVAQPMEGMPGFNPKINPKLPVNPNLKIFPKGRPLIRVPMGDDNSNTQFALLGLWTARRHGVPVDRTLLLSDHRFAVSQHPDGSWGYSFKGGGATPQMTGVGLLGLALGHGALLPEKRELTQAPKGGGDPAIQRGLEFLGKFVGDPEKAATPATKNPSLYLLWTVERVAMMYQLPTIGGNDWYGWGANHLLSTQKPTGEWPPSHYHGSSPPLDTAFSLLFLHRSNLVPDLTERLQLHMAIVDEEKK